MRRKRLEAAQQLAGTVDLAPEESHGPPVGWEGGLSAHRKSFRAGLDAETATLKVRNH